MGHDSSPDGHVSDARAPDVEPRLATGSFVSYFTVVHGVSNSGSCLFVYLP